MKKFFLYIIITLITSLFTVAYAEVTHFTGKASYTAESNESIKYAQDTALNEAMRNISMQAAVAIKSHYTSQENRLTDDMVEMVSATVMQIEKKDFSTEITSDEKIKVTAVVLASLDVEQAKKMSQKLLSVKNTLADYEKVQEEYATAQSQYSTMKEQYDSLMKKAARTKTKEGIKLEREGKKDEAFRLYQEAVHDDPDYARVYSRLGHIYRGQGKKELAEENYAKAAKLDPKEAGHHYGRAILLEQAGKKAEAAKEYRLFIEYSDILEYDEEIPVILKKIIELEENVS